MLLLGQGILQEWAMAIKGASKESTAVLTYITEISITETSLVIIFFNISTIKTFDCI